MDSEDLDTTADIVHGPYERASVDQKSVCGGLKGSRWSQEACFDLLICGQRMIDRMATRSNVEPGRPKRGSYSLLEIVSL